MDLQLQHWCNELKFLYMYVVGVYVFVQCRRGSLDNKEKGEKIFIAWPGLKDRGQQQNPVCIIRLISW